ncbi:C40 family peptidase [Compostibacter hankyongensis]|uniref:NlpC/P60 family protein n=1 Tax=Compostibacter hankyongensis TaxID=1007089 RepID=A0ABP8G6V0_9BACT
MIKHWRTAANGLIAVALALTSCSSVRKMVSSGNPHPAGREGNEASAQTASDKDNESLTFLDDIDLQRDGKSSRHRGGAYHSPALPPEMNSGLATSLAVRTKYSQLLGVSATDIDNISLYNFIDDWWGTPYRYGGETRRGIDCSAFVQSLYAAVFGLASIPRTASEQYQDSKKIKKASHLQEGDLVFFRIRSRRISHVGVYLKNNKFVHASLSAGVTISDLSDPYWHRYYVAGGEPE